MDNPREILISAVEHVGDLFESIFGSVSDAEKRKRRLKRSSEKQERLKKDEIVAAERQRMSEIHQSIRTIPAHLRKLGFGFLIVVVLVLWWIFGAAVDRYMTTKRVMREQHQTERAEKSRLTQEARLRKAEEERHAKLREQKPQIYQNGLDFLAAGNHQKALECFMQIALVDPSYKELPAKMKIADREVKKAWEEERSDKYRAAAKAKAAAKRTALDENRGGLSASVRFTGSQFVITNESRQTWSDVKMEINGGFFSGGYTLKADRMEPMQTYTVGAMQFAKAEGERFNPLQKKPQKFVIAANVPGERLEMWVGGWK